MVWLGGSGNVCFFQFGGQIERRRADSGVRTQKLGDTRRRLRGGAAECKATTLPKACRPLPRPFLDPRLGEDKECAGRMARRRGGFPATLFLSLCLLAAAVLLCSAEEPLGLAADDAPDFAIGDWLSSLVSGPSREEREALERQRRAETRPRKVLLALGCLGLAAFLLISRTAETIEERDDRPVHVALAFSGAEGARRARFPREKCRTLGDLKGLISRSEACGRPHGSSQTIVFNGRELVDDELDLGVLLPGVTGAEDWADQRVFPNAWTAQTVKEPKRRARDVSWGLCRRIEADSPGLALVAFALLALCADIF